MAALGMEGADDAPSLLRELHHRVKNNFQIIASLINLKKRTALPTQQGDLRFLEEHVMVMAAAHRLVFASRSMMEVDLTDLVVEVAEGLRVIAGTPAAGLSVKAPNAVCNVALDQAIAIGLYLAVTLPPYLNRAAATKSKVTVRLGTDPLNLKIEPEAGGKVDFDMLRQKLMAAYVRQLAANARHEVIDGGPALHFTLGDKKGRPGSLPLDPGTPS
jgi:hypothetical protein